MTERKIRYIPLLSQFLLIIIGLVLVFLAVSFVRQVGVSFQKREELERVRQRTLAARGEGEELQRRLDYVQSDIAVEEWAREHGWARFDEVLLVPVWAQSEANPEPQEGSGQEATPNSPRNAWWDMFFETQ